MLAPGCKGIGALGTPPRPEAYLPLSQYPSPSMQLAVKASGDRNSMAAGLRREVAALDPDQPLWSVQPLEEILGQTLQARRASTLLLGVFSGLALLLSVLRRAARWAGPCSSAAGSA